MPLSERGRIEAAQAGRLLGEADDLDLEIVHTSVLKRAIATANLLLEELDREWLPVRRHWRLNERHYGALQGLNKKETTEKYGAEQVHRWRRSYSEPPPALTPGDPQDPLEGSPLPGRPAQRAPAHGVPPGRRRPDRPVLERGHRTGPDRARRGSGRRPRQLDQGPTQASRRDLRRRDRRSRGPDRRALPDAPKRRPLGPRQRAPRRSRGDRRRYRRGQAPGRADALTLLS